MGIFVESELHRGSTIYNIPCLYRLDGAVDLAKLRGALERVILAHPYLSMTIGKGEKDTHMVALILGLARSLKIPVVAEGVETEEQLQTLRKLGCSLVQGYYFSRPLPSVEFEEKVIRKMQRDGDRAAGDAETDPER